MSDLSRAIIRCFFMLCLWWLAFCPALTGAIWTICLPCSIITFGCIFAAFFRLRLLWLIHILYAIAIAGVLLATRGQWIFPPAMWGILLSLTVGLLYYLKPDARFSVPQLPPQIQAPVRNAALLFITWAAGVLLICIKDSLYTPVIAIFWTCLILLLLYDCWNFIAMSEWIGYNTRRECFVPRKTWQKRWAATGLLTSIWIILCILWGIYS